MLDIIVQDLEERRSCYHDEKGNVSGISSAKDEIIKLSIK
jgi:hypothetical protein